MKLRWGTGTFLAQPVSRGYGGTGVRGQRDDPHDSNELYDTLDERIYERVESLKKYKTSRKKGCAKKKTVSL